MDATAVEQRLEPLCARPEVELMVLFGSHAREVGRPLYQRTGIEFAELASLALRRYNDTAKLRRAREEGLQAFLRERGLA